MRNLDVIQEEVKSCTKCGLHVTRTNTVFSRGNPAASLCVLGEAPGQEEDEQGIPFVGRSGKLLDEVLTEVGLDVSKDIYVANIIKCQPPNNRKPTEEETNSCMPYLEEQLEVVNPKVIVTLGATATSALVLVENSMTKLRGKFYKHHTASKTTLIMPTWHPSYVLRNGSTGKIYEEFKADLIAAINKSKELQNEQ